MANGDAHNATSSTRERSLTGAIAGVPTSCCTVAAIPASAMRPRRHRSDHTSRLISIATPGRRPAVIPRGPVPGMTISIPDPSGRPIARLRGQCSATLPRVRWLRNSPPGWRSECARGRRQSWCEPATARVRRRAATRRPGAAERISQRGLNSHPQIAARDSGRKPFEYDTVSAIFFQTAPPPAEMSNWHRPAPSVFGSRPASGRDPVERHQEISALFAPFGVLDRGDPPR